VDLPFAVVESPTGSIRYNGLSGRCKFFASLERSAPDPIRA